jgi:type I restriction enzyme R subunit
LDKLRDGVAALTDQPDLDQIDDAASVIEAFYAHAHVEMQREAQELIGAENLNAVLPKMSPLNPLYLTKKQTVFQKIVAFVEKFKGVGGQV